MLTLSPRLLTIFTATAVLAACDRAPEPAVPTPPRIAPAPTTAPTPPAFVPTVVEPPPPPLPPPPPQVTPSANEHRLPLARILAIAQRRVPGEVIDVELDENDNDDEPAVYELEILTPEGRVVEIRLDARTGAVIEIEED